MQLIEWLLWMLLASQSVMALAALSAGIEHRGARRSRRRRPALAESCLREIQRIVRSPFKDSADRRRQLESVRHRLESVGGPDPASAVLAAVMADPRRSPNEWTTLVPPATLSVERSAVRMCGMLAKVAPATGLAGTLIGIQLALANFDVSRGAGPEFTHGFSTALLSTLWGIAVLLMAVFCERVLWRPAITQLGDELLTLAVEARRTLAHLTAEDQHEPRLEETTPCPDRI